GRLEKDQGNSLVLDAQIRATEGDNSGAAQAFEAAGIRQTTQGELFHAAMSFRNAGDIYTRIGNDAKARPCFERGLALAKQIENVELIVAIEELLQPSVRERDR